MKNLVPPLLIVLCNTFGAVFSFVTVRFHSRVLGSRWTKIGPSSETQLRMVGANTARKKLYEYQDAFPRVAGKFFDRSVDFVVDTVAGKKRVQNSPKFSKHPVEKNKRVILALDGGGVRGLITAYVLQALENEIWKQTGNSNLRLAEVFDVVAGTSTGALLATYLTSYSLHSPRTISIDDDGNEITLDGSAKGAVEMYKAFAKKIFSEPQKPTGILQGTKNVIKRAWYSLPFTEILGKLKQRSLHSSDGLDDALGQAFPPEMDLNWLAEVRGKMIEDEESTVASLFVVSYDLVYHRPVAFYADRDFHRARFLAPDPFLEPYRNPASLRSKLTERREALENALEKYKKEHPQSILFKKANLGDAFIPLHKDQIIGGPVKVNYPRYSRALTKDVPITLGQVCRCSVAAPVYLPPGYVKDFYINDDGTRHALVCCDGGVVANAPAQACFNTVYYATCAEFLKDNMTFSTKDVRSRKGVKVEDFASQMVLSIGCGQLGRQNDPEAAKDLEIRDYLNPRSDIGNLISVLMSTGAQISHVNLETLFSAQGQLDNYLRIQLSANEKGEPGGITDPGVLAALRVLDNCSDDALDVYEKVGKMLGVVYKHEIEVFVRKMLEPCF